MRLAGLDTRNLAATARFNTDRAIADQAFSPLKKNAQALSRNPPDEDDCPLLRRHDCTFAGAAVGRSHGGGGGKGNAEARSHGLRHHDVRHRAGLGLAA
jgi:hypothetical protein